MKLLSLLYEGALSVHGAPSLSCLAFYNDTLMFFFVKELPYCHISL